MMSEPNILWLSLESVRADHTSIYEYERDTTPFLTTLSERQDATVLDPMIAASMWTPASTASLLTGTHMSTHQVGQDGKAQIPLSDSIQTLPQLLSKAGYQTALFTPNPYISSETGLDHGFDYTTKTNIRKKDLLGVDSVARDTIKCILQAFAKNPTLSLENIKETTAENDNCLLERRFRRWMNNQYHPSSPFFVYAHIPSPHHEYRPPIRYRDKFTSEIGLNSAEVTKISKDVYAGGSERIKQQMATGLEISDSEWDAIKALYDAEIRYADYTVKQLVQIAQASTEGPLIIIVVGDHGDLFGEYGLIGHNLVLHDGVIRVPGIVVGVSDIVDKESTVSQHIDLTYTIANITGVLVDQFQGRDLRDSSRPYAISQRGIAHLDAYTKYNEGFDTTRFFKSPVTSVRTTKWKLLSNNENQILYNLPDEKKDVSGEYPGVVSDLEEFIKSEKIFWKEPQGKQISYDEETKERLRGLGYLT